SFGGRLRSRELPADEAEHPHDTSLRTLFAEAREIVDGAMEDFAFHRALSALWHFIASVNRYVDGEAPWELAKNPGQEGRLRPVPKSRKLLKLTVRVGEETRTVVAGIAEHYPADTLPGRKVVIVANLEPATLMGVASNGMVLAGSAGETLALVGLDRDLPPGAVVR